MTLEKDLNNFLLETLTWFKLSLSLQKYVVSKRVIVQVSYYSRVLSEYANKSGGLEKSEIWNGWLLIIPLFIVKPDTFSSIHS